MRGDGNYRGWYWSWLGGLLSLILGAGLEAVAVILAIRNALGDSSDLVFQLATILAIAGVAFILLGFAIRQSCGGCCDWEDCYAPNTELRSGSTKT